MKVSSVRLRVSVFVNNVLQEKASKRIFVLKVKKWGNDENYQMRIVITCIIHEILLP